MIIGITGQIGSGKSTAARMLKSLGAAVVDADRIGREVVENNPQLLTKLVKQFGGDILTRDGKLRRKRLASLAFADENSRQHLNRLVHPYLLRELKRQVKALRATHDLVVIDAALLLEWRLNAILDVVILIHAAEKNRLDRLERKGFSRADALARQRRQLKYTLQRKSADYVILNNGTRHDLERKLKKLILGQ